MTRKPNLTNHRLGRAGRKADLTVSLVTTIYGSWRLFLTMASQPWAARTLSMLGIHIVPPSAVAAMVAGCFCQPMLKAALKTAKELFDPSA